MAFAIGCVLFALHALIVAAMLLHPARLGRQSGDASHDANYSLALAFIGYVPIFAAQAWALNEVRKDGVPIEWAGAGAATFLVGLVVRLWAIATLGRAFTMEIGIRAGHEIIEKGPYRWVRHPSYAGYLLMLAGIGIATRSWVGSMVPLIETGVFQYFRIRSEEAMLVAHFGDAYRAYIARTRRLLPFIF